MIRYADKNDMQTVWNMWKTCFGDCDAYMHIYFREKYRPENTLLYFDNDKAVASLQMLPYQFTFHERELPIAYFSGLCTLPEAREKGFMAALIEKSFAELEKRKISIAILVPQETRLIEFYDKFGFEQTFDAGPKNLSSLKDLLERHEGHIDEAYTEFNRWFRKKDMTVQKSLDDFRVIIEEAKLFDFLPKKNLIGMARIIDAEYLLSIFADNYPEKSVSLSVNDELIPKNNQTFMFHIGKVIKNPSHASNFIEINIRTLAQLLLGYHISEKEEPFRLLFPKKVPQLNLMLE